MVVFFQTSFKSVFGIIDTPQHLGYEEIIKKVNPLPDQQVTAIIKNNHELDLYARYSDNRDSNLALLFENKARLLYQWSVTVTKGEDSREEIFSLDGEKLGFTQTVLDKTAYPSLDKVKATDLVHSKMREEGLNLDQWQQQHYMEFNKGARKDHIYRFARKTKIFADAQQIIFAKVSGNQLTTFLPMVKLPESFERKIVEIRQANIYLGILGILGYLFFSLVLSMVACFLIRKKGFLWHSTIVTMLGLICMKVFLTLNFAPQTIQSLPYFYPQLLKVAILVKQALQSAASLFNISIAVLAGLTLNSLVFKGRPSWLSWFKPSGYCNPLSRNVVYWGYLSTLLFFTYNITYYFITQKYFNFFLPPSIDYGGMNFQMSYAPGLAAIASAIFPGFSEEIIYRLVPLGLLAYYKKSPKDPLWWLGVMLQAVLFAVAHAEYPAEPFYSRVLELIIPAVMFALLVWYVDIMAAVLSHTLYDAVWMGYSFFSFQPSVSLFVYFLMLFLPLLLCIYGAFTTPKRLLVNEGDQLTRPSYQIEMPAYVVKPPIWIWPLLLTGVLLASVQMASISHTPTSSYQDALKQSQLFWGAQGFKTDQWVLSATPAAISVTDWYDAQSEYPDKWKQLIPRFLPVGCYNVTAISLDKQWQDDTFYTGVCGGKVIQFNHRMPEVAFAAQKDIESDIKSAIKDYVGVPLAHLKLLSQSETKLPNRTDTFQTYRLTQYQDIKPKYSDALQVNLSTNGERVTSLETNYNILQDTMRQYSIMQSWLGVFDFSSIMDFLIALCVFAVMMIFYQTQGSIFANRMIYILISGVFITSVILRHDAFIVELRSVKFPAEYVGLLTYLLAALMLLVGYVVKKVLSSTYYLLRRQENNLFSVLLGVTLSTLTFAITKTITAYFSPDSLAAINLFNAFTMAKDPYVNALSTSLMVLVGVCIAINTVHILMQVVPTMMPISLGLLVIISYFGKIDWPSYMHIYTALAFFGMAILWGYLVRFGLIGLAVFLFGLAFLELWSISPEVGAWILPMGAFVYLIVLGVSSQSNHSSYDGLRVK